MVKTLSFYVWNGNDIGRTRNLTSEKKGNALQIFLLNGK